MRSMKKRRSSALMILSVKRKRTNTKKSDDQADRLPERAADHHPERDLPALVADTMTMMTSMIDPDDHLEEESQVAEDPHQDGDHQVEDADRLFLTLDTRNPPPLHAGLRR